MRGAAQVANLPILSEIDYLEAHATGTKVGDKIEGSAIANLHQNRVTPLKVASVKSNIGHMECASFSASLFKVLIMFRYRKFIPMSENFTMMKPEI